MAIHRQVDRGNGIISLVRVRLETTSETPLSDLEQIIIELLEKIDKQESVIKELQRRNDKMEFTIAQRIHNEL